MLSIASLSGQSLIYKPFPLFHRRKDSGELDVFEAAQYFSGYIEANGGNFDGRNFMPKISREESKSWRRRARMSLDMTIETIPSEQSSNGVEKQEKGKKFKQPTSDGGKKLASFLNSLFNQTVSKKKKKKTKSMNLSWDFGQNPTKNYKEFKQNETPLKHSAEPDDSEEKKKKSSTIMEAKSKFRNGFLKKQKKNAVNGVSGKDQKLFKRGAVDEDDGDSDSSSDLFELQIANLDYCSSNERKACHG